jgi:hypothetical protein
MLEKGSNYSICIVGAATELDTQNVDAQTSSK